MKGTCMPAWITKILGINFKTTLAGIGSLAAIAAAIIAAWKEKDFQAIFDNLPLLFTALGVVIASLGLLKAKDQNVTGAGPVAVTVTADGSATDRQGEDVGTVKTAATEQIAVKP